VPAAASSKPADGEEECGKLVETAADAVGIALQPAMDSGQRYCAHDDCAFSY